MLTALVNVILPVIVVAGVGAALARSFTLDQGTLTKVQLYALTPALAFSSLMRTTVSASETAGLAAGYFGATAVMALVAWAIGRLGLAPGTRRGMVACVLLGNNGNFGLPIALLALGQEGLDQAVVLFLFSVTLTWTVGPALFGAQGGLLDALRVIGRLPVAWVLVLALGLRVAGLALPTPVMTAVDLLGQATIPMVLLSLGLQLGAARSVRVTAPVVTAVALRVLALPLLGWGVGLAVGLNGLPLQSLVLALAMPTAVNTLMLAVEYDADPDTVASAVAISTVLSIATLAVLVANLSLIG